jgi:hypothetical protein
MAKSRKKTDFTKNIFEKLGNNKAVNEAQRVINLAVDVLEEEVAAGILAAKKIEKKIIDVDEARGSDPEDVLNRFRRDAHDVLDIFMDSVSVLYRKADFIKNEFVNTDEPVNNSNGNIPIIKPDKPSSPGQSIKIPIALINDEKDEKTIEFQTSELISETGAKITSRNIKIEPSSIQLAKGEKAVAQIHVNIIKTAKKGVYSGLFVDKANPKTKMVVEVEIETQI